MQETKAGVMACRMDCSFNNHVGIGSRLQDLLGEALMTLDSCCSDVRMELFGGDGISGSSVRGKCRTSTLSRPFLMPLTFCLEKVAKLSARVLLDAEDGTQALIFWKRLFTNLKGALGRSRVEPLSIVLNLRLRNEASNHMTLFQYNSL